MAVATIALRRPQSLTCFHVFSFVYAAFPLSALSGAFLRALSLVVFSFSLSIAFVSVVSFLLFNT